MFTGFQVRGFPLARFHRFALKARPLVGVLISLASLIFRVLPFAALLPRVVAPLLFVFARIRSPGLGVRGSTRISILKVFKLSPSLDAARKHHF